MNWLEFYEPRLVLKGEPNPDGWVSCCCPIHIHGEDKEYKAGINVFSGSFRCFSANCSTAYRQKLGTHLDSMILSPREFLIVAEGLTELEALEQLSSISSDIISEEKDDTFEKHYHPNKQWNTDILVYQKALSPELDIVREYCAIKGIRYETLKSFGAGYNVEKECITLPYMYKKGVAGIRNRFADGSKRAEKGSFGCLYNIDKAISSGASTIIVVEGETDCMYLTQLLQDNDIQIPVISTPGCYFKQEWKRNVLHFQKIVVVPQNDFASNKLITDLRKLLDKKVDVVSMVWKPLTWGKDISEFCLQHDTGNLLKQIAACSQYKPRHLMGQELVAMSGIEIPYIIEELVERNTKTLLVGEPKTYKTFSALALMDCIVNGTPFLGIFNSTYPGMRAMLVEEEGSEVRLAHRVKVVTRGEGLDRMKFIHRQMVQLDDNDSVNELIQDVLDFEPDILILDPYANLHSQEENSATGTQIVVAAMNKLLIAYPHMALVIIHHQGKSSATPRGSSALWGAMDQLITFNKRGDRVEIDIKGRDLPNNISNKMLAEFNPETFKLEPVRIIIKNNDNDEESEEEESKMGMYKATVEAEKVMRRFFKKQLETNPEFSGTQTEIFDKFSGMGFAYNTYKKIMDSLTEDGTLTVTGEGKRGNPKIYKLGITKEE